MRTPMTRAQIMLAALLSLSLPVLAASGDAEAGKKKSAPCAACHGAGFDNAAYLDCIRRKLIST